MLFYCYCCMFKHWQVNVCFFSVRFPSMFYMLSKLSGFFFFFLYLHFFGQNKTEQQQNYLFSLITGWSFGNGQSCNENSSIVSPNCLWQSETSTFHCILGNNSLPPLTETCTFFSVRCRWMYYYDSCFGLVGLVGLVMNRKKKLTTSSNQGTHLTKKRNTNLRMYI